jgi:mono/diheme cytochrome c family protein
LMQIDSNAAPAFVKSCKFCHAPAIEQSEFVERGESDGEVEKIEADSAFISNPAYDERLAKSGVSCAVCHIRGGVVVGPENPTDLPGEAPHEVSTSLLFESSEFCAACHQLDRGYELNGKVLTNTYREWKESAYGKRNITCQQCHMPDRRHEFRGIHDPDMVKGGLDIKVIRVPAPEGIKAALSIKNAAVGHMFPTYVTPIVVVKAYMLDFDGKVIEESVEKGFIGRLISQDLSTEYFDTRLKPFQSYVLEYDTAGRDVKHAERLVFEITVRPDEFYDRMFKRAIEHGRSGFVEAELKEAERRSDASPYLLFKEEISLGD